MSKSNILKTREKTVKTNLSIGFIDFTALDSGTVETGAPIYTVPRKGEAKFTQMLWSVYIEQDPGNFAVIYAIIDHGGDDGQLEGSELSLVQRALFVTRQQWRTVTNVGVLDTVKTTDVDMKDLVITRRSNLQSDNESSISPAYRSGTAISVGQTGVMSVEETLFQLILRDDPAEWSGYTFEESAS